MTCQWGFIRSKTDCSRCRGGEVGCYRKVSGAHLHSGSTDCMSLSLGSRTPARILRVLEILVSVLSCHPSVPKPEIAIQSATLESVFITDNVAACGPLTYIWIVSTPQFPNSPIPTFPHASSFSSSPSDPESEMISCDLY
jgi:hypothetical protein